MKRGTLFYDTRHGSTRRICDWIAQGLHSTARVTIRRIGEGPEEEGDFIIAGSPVFLGKPMDSMVHFLQQRQRSWNGKPVFLFVVSWAETTPYREECRRFLDLFAAALWPASPTLCASLPGRLILDQLPEQEQRAMARLLRRIDQRSAEFDSSTIAWSDGRSRKRCLQFAQDIASCLKEDGI